MSEMLEMLEQCASEHQGSNITAIDMRSVSPFTDWFLIITAKNLRHANALAEQLIQEAEKHGYSVRIKEGEEGSSWILIDFNEVVVHVFTEEGRQQYRLENLWGDLPMTRYEEKETA